MNDNPSTEELLLAAKVRELAVIRRNHEQRLAQESGDSNAAAQLAALPFEHWLQDAHEQLIAIARMLR